MPPVAMAAVIATTNINNRPGTGTPAPRPKKKQACRYEGGGRKILGFINSTGVQVVLYFVFVVIFQFLASTVRVPQEYLFNKAVMDRIVVHADRVLPSAASRCLACADCARCALDCVPLDCT